MDLLLVGGAVLAAAAVGGGAGAWARGHVNLKNRKQEKAIEATLTEKTVPKKRENIRPFIIQQDEARHATVVAERSALLEEMRADLSLLSNQVPEDRTAALGLLINHLTNSEFKGCKNYEHNRSERHELVGRIICFAPDSCPENAWQKRTGYYHNQASSYGLLDFNARIPLFHNSSRSMSQQRSLSQGFATQLKNLLAVAAAFPQKHPSLDVVDEVLMGMATYMHDALRPSVASVRPENATAHATEALRAKTLKSAIPKVTAQLKEERNLLTEDDFTDALFQAAPLTEKSTDSTVEILPAKLPYQELLDSFVDVSEVMSHDQSRKFEMWSTQVKAATEMLTMAAASSSPRKVEMVDLAQGNYDLAEAGLMHLLSELQAQADGNVLKSLRVTQVFLEDQVSEVSRDD